MFSSPEKQTRTLMTLACIIKDFFSYDFSIKTLGNEMKFCVYVFK